MSPFLKRVKQSQSYYAQEQINWVIMLKIQIISMWCLKDSWSDDIETIAEVHFYQMRSFVSAKIELIVTE